MLQNWKTITHSFLLKHPIHLEIFDNIQFILYHKFIVGITLDLYNEIHAVNLFLQRFSTDV